MPITRKCSAWILKFQSNYIKFTGNSNIICFQNGRSTKKWKNHYTNKVTRNLTTTWEHFMTRPETKKAIHEYGKSTLLCLRSGIERYLNFPPYNRGSKFSQNPVFKNSNMMLNAKIKDLKQKDKVKCWTQTWYFHTRPTEAKMPSNTVSFDSSWLIKKCLVPYNSLLVPQGPYLTSSSFKFLKDENKRPYATIGSLRSDDGSPA